MDLSVTYIDKKHRDEYELYQLKKQNKNVKIEASIFIFVQVCILIISYIEKVSPLYHDSIIVYYRFCSLSFIIIMGIRIMFSELINKGKIVKLNTIVTLDVMFSAIFLNWAMLITLLDLIKGYRTFYFIIVVLILAINIRVRPKLYSGILILSHIIFGVLSFQIDVDIEGIISNIITTFIFLLAALIFIRNRIDANVEVFIKQKIIEKQNEKLRKMNQQLLDISSEDYLTGLFNKRKLSELLNDLFFQAKEKKEKFSVIMIEIDYFKTYNDIYGHAAGDDCIKKVANIINGYNEKTIAFATRYGGNEFCMIFTGCPKEAVHQMISELKAEVMNLNIENTTSQTYDILTVSCGYFTDTIEQYNDPWECIELAEKDLYINKSMRANKK